MHTLVYHYGGLGDFLTLFPLLSRLRRSSSDRVTLLGKPIYATLAEANGLIDICIDADSAKYRTLFIPLKDILYYTSFFTQYDRVILFCTQGTPLHENAAIAFKGSLYRQNPLPDQIQPVSDYRLNLLNSITDSNDTHSPDLSTAINRHRLKKNIHIQSTTVALHPGSGSTLKNWPLERFLTLADQLRHKGLTVCWFSGPAEALPPAPDTDRHFHSLSLLDAATLLTKCRVYVGNDSGFSHLAATAACPAVVLFGPSDPRIWAPHGKAKVTVLHHPQPCGPCHQYSTTGSCGVHCLDSITVSEVLAAVLQIIAPHCHNTN